jgi:hypothetical protein
MGIISLVFDPPGAAQALTGHSRGYFQRLALAPVCPLSFVLAAILADAAGVFVSS